MMIGPLRGCLAAGLRHGLSRRSRLPQSFSQLYQLSSTQRFRSSSPRHSSSRTTACKASKQHHEAPRQPLSPLAAGFWTSISTWRRASINTLRCLLGCTSGDFAAMWFLQANYPEMGTGTIMAISSAFIRWWQARRNEPSRVPLLDSNRRPN